MFSCFYGTFIQKSLFFLLRFFIGERDRESRRSSGLRPTPTPRTSVVGVGRGQSSVGASGYVPTFREELTRATAAAIADMEGTRTTPIHQPLREMGFSDRHISQVRTFCSLQI